MFLEEGIKKGNTFQTAASQPHGGISLYRDILSNVLDETSAKTKPQQPNNAVSGDSSLSADYENGITSAEPNGKPTVSYSKGNIKNRNEQGKSEKVSASERPNDVQVAVATAEAETNENGQESKASYTIASTSYTNKKGKTSPMHLVTFGRDLSKDEIYRVKTTMKEYENPQKANGHYTYEVTKIEVLDGQTTKPLSVSSRKSNTSNDSHDLNSELEARDLSDLERAANGLLPLAKLLKDFEKSMMVAKNQSHRPQIA